MTRRWTRDAKTWQLTSGTDLNAAVAATGCQVITAYDIHDRGPRAATCKNPAGEPRGCVLTVR